MCFLATATANSRIDGADNRNGQGGVVGSGMMVGQPPSTKLILKRRGDIIYPASMDESDLKPDMLTLKMKLSDRRPNKKRHKNKSGGSTKRHHRSGKSGSKSSLTRGKSRSSRSPMPSMVSVISSNESTVDMNNSRDTDGATSSDLLLRKASEKVFGDGVDDEWDDYCFYCNQGCDDETGELGCCATCPHVFHNQCHVPKIHMPMGDLP